MAMTSVLMRAARMLSVVAVALIVGVLAFGWLIGFEAPAPDGLGLVDGRLAPCPPSPNCVSSQAEDGAQRVDPLPLDGADGQDMAAWQRALLQMPGVEIRDAQPGYLRATARTRWLGFVDDLELWVDDEQRVVQVRSASRVGHSDLGANRRRIEQLRALPRDGADGDTP
jgi:uncharacterized protein (DUF1499 family)